MIMEKEFEALDNLALEVPIGNRDIAILKSTLTELKAIKESKPSKAMETLTRMDNLYCAVCPQKKGGCNECEYNQKSNIVYQALLKAREQDKMLEIIKEKNVDIWLVNSCFTVEQYNFSIIKIGNSNVFTLTPEEFDLLKRWVEND